MDLKDLERELKSDGEIVAYKLEEWAEKIGDKTCFYYGEEGKHITYKEFNELSNSIGHNLKAMGVEKGDRISLFLKNPLVTTLAMFGIWKVGAVFCPINFNYRGRLLSYQIKDTNPKLLISETDMIPLINDIKDDIPGLTVFLHKPKQGDHDYNPETANIELDKKFLQYPFEELFKGETSNLGINIEYYDTANIIYTSGTTGPAKGVVQSHRWMNQYTFNSRRFCSQEDVVYNDLPLYHVGGAFANVIKGIWLGCTVAVWDKFSSNDFWRRIKVSGATTAILLDVMIPWLMNAKETPDDRMNTLNKVHMQPLPQYHYQVAKRFGFDYVTCGYGQTEAGNGFVGIFELDEGEGTPPELYKGKSREEIRALAKKYGYPIHPGKAELGKGYMGKCKWLLEATILNEHDEECAPGEVGQLAFRPKFSYSMLNEYFGKPEATLKAFRNFWFHTGDACYKDEEGNFYFVDRMGGFIRTRGENISSYQIEDIINSHPKVEMCAALPIPAEVGDEDDIVVYVVVKKGEKLPEGELREWLKGEMPKFMWPKYIRFIDDLPRTPTNKIEKYKLREKILSELGRK
ncbi:AMP-binding protein [Desulfallas sp. Bu1-1]|uniref:AMP-binding protein n=1 Tax=Desulfallas sp. Bu1-1 TaxID=2787620 RepID=UPI00189ED58D|nr:AMP-binding protein [Desulfallas sp. Bu1-1]MBF7082754.1 AMP-binding protein [Desulfallas sp. Bu1-1]